MSSPPSRLPPAGQRLPHDICALFKSPPEYLCVLQPPSVSPATSAPLYFCHDDACERPCVPRPSFSSAAGFVSFLFRHNSSPGFHCAPEHSCLPLCHVRCLHSVPGPLRTSVLCSDPLLSTSLCQQYFVCLCPPWGPLIPITTPPETVLVPHGTLGALQPFLYLSYSDRTLPQACSVLQTSLTLFTAF